MVWYGMCGMVRYGLCGMVWYGTAWCGKVRYGMVWYGMVQQGMQWVRRKESMRNFNVRSAIGLLMFALRHSTFYILYSMDIYVTQIKGKTHSV